MAIRGNGELMPAHWGAISQVVQKKGYPSALAGGSSASITLFLMESLAINPMNLNDTQKSLMVKSFQGYFEALSQTEEGKAIAALLGDKKFMAKLAHIWRLIEQGSGPGSYDQARLLREFRRQLPAIMTLLNSKDLKDIINPEFKSYVAQTLAMSQQNDPQQAGQLLFRKKEIEKAIKEFGRFNAVTDNTLFFRPGLVNFKAIALILGQMGDFYAGVKLSHPGAQAAVEKDTRDFINLCAPGSEKLTWAQIVRSKPACRQLLGRAVLTRRKAAQEIGQASLRIQEMAGSHLLTLPATSALKGEAVQRYREFKSRYLRNSSMNFGSQFRISQKDLRFAYWGKTSELNKIGAQLKRDPISKNDEKSKKFYALGDATWYDIISTSPAEPGLSNFIDISENTISAGGWSDLHPTLALKASGCQDIVYITRKGGESMFSQDVMERLTDIDGFDWADWINLSPAQKYAKRKRGNPRDVGPYASLWSKLYNSANPKSSLRTSMRAATSTVCTDWDSFNVKRQLNALVENAFRAPWLGQRQPPCI